MLEIDVTHFDTMCRTCLIANHFSIPNKQLQSLYDPPSGFQIESRIIDLLQKTVGDLSINQSDSLPKVVCLKCTKTIVDFYSFQIQCLNSEKVLLQTIAARENGLVDLFDKPNKAIKDPLEKDVANLCKFEMPQIGTCLFIDQNKSLEEIQKTNPIKETKTTRRNTIGQEDKYTCPICDKKFPTSFNCRRHMKVHGVTIQMTRSMAPKSSKSKSLNVENERYNITQLTSQETDETQHSCGREAKYVSSARNREVSCNICGRVFAKRFSLKRHIQVHIPKKKETSIDDRLQKNDEEPGALQNEKMAIELSEQRQIHKEDGVTDSSPNESSLPGYTIGPTKKYQCSICSRCCSSNSNLKRHFKIHDPNHQALKVASLELARKSKHRKNIFHKLVCDECPLRFNNEKALTTHKQNHKEAFDGSALKKVTSSLYTCPLCGITLNSVTYLKNHKRSHRIIRNPNDPGTELRPYVCNQCSKAFSTHNNLQEHMRTHTGETPYLCTECGKSFGSHSTLKEHKLRHSKILRFECPYCPKRFTNQSDQAAHRKIHLKVKSHVCELCGAAFGRSHSLRVHMMRHSNNRPYKCDYCNKGFVSNNSLRTHVRTHTGEKPFKCQYCDRGFAQHTDMIKHMKHHVGEYIYRCKLCPQGFRLLAELREHFATHKNDDEETKDKNLKALKESEEKLRQELAAKGIFVDKPLIDLMPQGNVFRKKHQEYDL